MAPAYKLIYFGSRGITEPARFLLKYGGIEFDDIRIDVEDWPQWKPKTPFGTVPILEHNGKRVDQSLAITRYLARQVKLAGNNDWEDLEIDAIVETISDVMRKLVPAFMERDENIKKSLINVVSQETLPFYLSRFEDVVKKNKGYLAVGRLTWADFYFAHISTFFDHVVRGDSLTKYPNLKDVREKVLSIPAVKKWIEVRPDLEFLQLAN